VFQAQFPSRVVEAEALYLMARSAIEHDGDREKVRMALESLYKNLKIIGVPRQRRPVASTRSSPPGPPR
jgi:hypothetical protein